MSIYELAHIISGGLTVITILMCGLVVIVWGKAAITTIVQRTNTPQGFFILGVFISFFGEVVSNIFNLIQWTALSLGYDMGHTMFVNAILVDIPIRQVLGIVAAYCHIRAALLFSHELDRTSPERLVFGTYQLHNVVRVCTFLGCVYALLMCVNIIVN